jgi:hypothetical protein
MAKNCINPSCGKEIPTNATFCSFCGAQQIEEQKLSEEEKLRKELSEMQETIALLKKALSDAQKNKDSSVENVQRIDNLQKQLALMQEKNKTLQNTVRTPPKPESKPFPVAVLLVGLALLLLVGGLVGYFIFYEPYVTDRDAPRYYVYTATNTFLRSTQVAGVDYNVIGRVPYGSELIVYENGTEWSNIKWKNGETALKGYMASPYILPQKDFFLLNSIWGDTDSKEVINTSKCRLALLNFYKENNYYGVIDYQIMQDVFGVSSIPSENIWQVFSKDKASKSNTSYFKRITNPNSKFTDFAVIIKNTDTGRRKCLLFSFSDDETPYFEYQEDAPYEGDIFSIKQTFSNYGYTGYKIEYR